jgi:hypothetical protein
MNLRALTILLATIVTFPLSASLVATQGIPESNMIKIERPVHFQAAAGGTAVAAPDEYMVIGVEQGRLLLVPEKGKVPLVIVAETARHEESVGGPVARAASTGPDEHRVLLLLPSGERREAIGTYTGTKHVAARPPAPSAPTSAPPAMATPAPAPFMAPPVAMTPAPPSNFAFNGPAAQAMPRSGMPAEALSTLPTDQQILMGIQRLESKLQWLEQRLSSVELKLDSKFSSGGMR